MRRAVRAEEPVQRYLKKRADNFCRDGRRRENRRALYKRFVPVAFDVLLNSFFVNYIPFQQNV
jgi:hypothetical protein